MNSGPLSLTKRITLDGSDGRVAARCASKSSDPTLATIEGQFITPTDQSWVVGVGDRITSIPFCTKEPFSLAIRIGQFPVPGNAITETAEDLRQIPCTL